jgi:nucleoside-diphosphate-sugar epimerase
MGVKFVTGGAGFLGTKLVKKLVKKGDEVIVFDKVSFKSVELPKNARYIQGDVVDFHKFSKELKGVDCVYHCAAALPISKSGNYFWKVNVEGTEKILKASLKHNVRKLIFVSSSAIYTPKKELLPINEKTIMKPLGTYGSSKYDAEIVIKKYKKKGLDITSVRPRTILGEGRLGIFQILFEWISKNKKIYILGKGDNLFQFLGLDDLIDAMILADKKRCVNEDFNLGAEKYGTIRGDLEWLIKKVGSKSPVVSINVWIGRNLLLILDKIGLSPLVDLHYKSPHKAFYFDISKAKRILGWKPKQSNKDLLFKTYDWYSNLDKSKLKYGRTHKSIQKQSILKIIKWFS